MKSAYELAMERLEKKAPSVALTAEQKAQIAEIDSTFKARIAERELFLKEQIGKARGSGNAEEADTLQKQLTIDLRRLQEDAEAKKEKTPVLFFGLTTGNSALFAPGAGAAASIREEIFFPFCGCRPDLRASLQHSWGFRSRRGTLFPERVGFFTEKSLESAIANAARARLS